MSDNLRYICRCGHSEGLHAANCLATGGCSCQQFVPLLPKENERKDYTLWLAPVPTKDWYPVEWTPHEFHTVAGCLNYLLASKYDGLWRITKNVRVMVGGDDGCEDGIDWTELSPLS